MPVTVHFARLSQTPTVFRVHPKLEDVFSPGEVSRCAKFFRPALTVDLSRVRPSWSGLAHILYYEPGQDKPSRFRVDGDHYMYLGDFTECDSTLEVEQNVPSKAPYVELVSAEVPLFDNAWTATPRAIKRSRLVFEEHKRLDQYWTTLSEMAGDTDFWWDSTDFFFGHTPHWTQHDQTPRDPDGRPMDFVGQLRADYLTDHAADFDCYLFYSPRYRIVSQVLQMT
jgi:hypothetical protein